jgi:nucleoid DNA-binding protein
LSFFCCGIKYSTNDPDTYWCIDTDILTQPTKKNVDNKKIVKEICETLTCKKNGCLKIQISRFANFKGKLKKIEVEELKGHKAFCYLEKTSKIRIRQPQKSPMVFIPQASKNDFVYGKAIGKEAQKIRYLNEQGWASDKKLISKVRYL